MTKLTKKQQTEVKKQVKKEVKKEKKKLSKRLLAQSSEFKSEYRRYLTTALIAAFGLIIALSWQTVIRKFVESIPKSGILLYHPYLTDLYTAILVTFIAVIAIMLISKWAKK